MDRCSRLLAQVDLRYMPPAKICSEHEVAAESAICRVLQEVVVGVFNESRHLAIWVYTNNSIRAITTDVQVASCVKADAVDNHLGIAPTDFSPTPLPAPQDP